jgi:hypothetical protein
MVFNNSGMHCCPTTAWIVASTIMHHAVRSCTWHPKSEATYSILLAPHLATKTHRLL